MTDQIVGFPKVVSISSSEFGDRYDLFFLFIERNTPADHDLLVTDFVGVYPNEKAAIDFYAFLHDIDDNYAPFALIVGYRDSSFDPLYRTHGQAARATQSPYAGWDYAYDMPEETSEWIE